MDGKGQKEQRSDRENAAKEAGSRPLRTIAVPGAAHQPRWTPAVQQSGTLWQCDQICSLFRAATFRTRTLRAVRAVRPAKRPATRKKGHPPGSEVASLNLIASR